MELWNKYFVTFNESCMWWRCGSPLAYSVFCTLFLYSVFCILYSVLCISILCILSTVLCTSFHSFPRGPTSCEMPKLEPPRTGAPWRLPLCNRDLSGVSVGYLWNMVLVLLRTSFSYDQSCNLLYSHIPCWIYSSCIRRGPTAGRVQSQL